MKRPHATKERQQQRRKRETQFSCLEGDVAVLLDGVIETLLAEDLEVLADVSTGDGGLDDVIDETAAGSGEGVGELLLVLVLTGSDIGVLAVDDLDGSLGTHDGDLSRGPAVVGVSTQVL